MSSKRFLVVTMATLVSLTASLTFAQKVAPVQDTRREGGYRGKRGLGGWMS